MLEYNHCYIKASCHGQHTGPVTQKESILEGKVCIEHVIFWWKTRSCAEKGARDRMLMAVVVLSHYTLLITWAFVVVRYDPMICCVLHARVHTAERHQPTPPPPLPLIVGALQLKGTGTSLFNAALYTVYSDTRQSQSGHRTTPAVTFHLVFTNSSQLNTASSNIKHATTLATPNLQHFIDIHSW